MLPCVCLAIDHRRRRARGPLFSSHHIFDSSHLLLNRRTATWNLFVNKKLRTFGRLIHCSIRLNTGFKPKFLGSIGNAQTDSSTASFGSIGQRDEESFLESLTKFVTSPKQIKKTNAEPFQSMQVLFFFSRK